MVDDRAAAESRNDERHRLMPGAGGARSGRCRLIQPIFAAMWVASSTSPVRRRIRSASMPATSACARRSIQMTHGAERSAAGVDRDAAVELAGDRDALDVPGRNTGGSERARDGRLQRAQPQARILLGPARSGKIRLVRHARLAAQDEIGIDHHRLQALRAEVDADDRHCQAISQSARTSRSCETMEPLVGE